MQSKKYLIPRFHSGTLIGDLYFLMVMLFIQTTLIPKIIPNITTELITIWLCLFSVFLSPLRCILFGFLAALGLETHYLVPASFYMFNYWIVGILIVLVRNHISWRNYWPWLTTFLLASLWINTSETFMLIVKSNNYGHTPWQYATSLLIRLTFTTAVGFFIVSRQIIGQFEEPCP